MRRSIFGARPARRVAQALGSQQQPRRTFATPPIKSTTPPAPIEPSQEQAHPIGPFYQSILNSAQPIPNKKPEVPPVTAKTSPPSPPVAPAPETKPAAAVTPEPAAPATAPAPAKRGRKPKENGKAKSVDPSSPSSPEEAAEAAEAKTETAVNGPSNDVQARARVVFGSRLAGPAERAERLAAIRTQSRLVAGVLVPPHPEEPDNCCMSGCVDCVWDWYRDEMEEWSAAHSEADRRLRAQEAGVGVTGASMEGTELSAKLDLGPATVHDDGGGSVGNWDAGSRGSSRSGTVSKDFWDDELYKNVPVGIREFMKQEKRLKEKHLREGTVGG